MAEMKIIKTALAGTLESSDVYVEVVPRDTIHIEIESIVAAQFEQAISQAVRQTVQALGVTGAGIVLKDRGALDCVIRARVETALRRGAAANVAVTEA
jgi:citrate lyase subunit gamma (acyl carrier protein)